MIKTLFGVIATSLLLTAGRAARVCGPSTNTTYAWKINDARFDGPDPDKADGLATVAISISPGNSPTLFECNAQWTEAWAGWYDGGSNIVWSDCIWTGNGPTQDTTTSFALDWAKRTMYMAHTFNCSDAAGYGPLLTRNGSLCFLL